VAQYLFHKAATTMRLKNCHEKSIFIDKTSHDLLDRRTVQGNQEASKWTKWSNNHWFFAVNASFEMGQEDPILGGNKFQIISKHGQTNVT